jgi:hypothetical protein
MNNSRYGNNNPAFKDGRTLIAHYCIDCKVKKINYCTWLYGNKRCTSCSKKGIRNVNWSGGYENKKKRCRICHKKLSHVDNKTELCIYHYSHSLNAKNNPNYKHGKTSLADSLRQTEQYIEWRNKIYQRDHYTYQTCNKKSRRINAHHKLPLLDLLLFYNIKTIDSALKCKLLWDINWGITLCCKCHNNIESVRR